MVTLPEGLVVYTPGDYSQRVVQESDKIIEKRFMDEVEE